LIDGGGGRAGEKRVRFREVEKKERGFYDWSKRMTYYRENTIHGRSKDSVGLKGSIGLENRREPERGGREVGGKNRKKE